MVKVRWGGLGWDLAARNDGLAEEYGHRVEGGGWRMAGSLVHKRV